MSLSKEPNDAERGYAESVLASEEWDDCRTWVVWTLYKVGVIGLKTVLIKRFVVISRS
jgi:hypothetical protein